MCVEWSKGGEREGSLNLLTGFPPFCFFKNNTFNVETTSNVKVKLLKSSSDPCP